MREPSLEGGDQYVRVYGIQISRCSEVVTSFSCCKVCCDPLLLGDIAVCLGNAESILKTCKSYQRAKAGKEVGGRANWVLPLNGMQLTT